MKKCTTDKKESARGAKIAMLHSCQNYTVLDKQEYAHK